MIVIVAQSLDNFVINNPMWTLYAKFIFDLTQTFGYFNASAL